MGSQLDGFLGVTLQCVQQKDGAKLKALFVVDFDSIDQGQQQSYQNLNQELLRKYGNDNTLEERCRKALSKGSTDDQWNSFTSLVVTYLRFVREYLTFSLRDKLFKIKDIANQSIIALGDTTHGVLILPTVLYLSRVLARIATESSKNPSLVANNLLDVDNTQSEGTPRKVTFVDESANILREAFIRCLSGGLNTITSRTTRPSPNDKRIGIYLTANSCLKLLFQSRKLRNAQQLFLSIDAQSPLLSVYPAAQRVTYLYYLGRYHFANNHFYRAQLALQAAYDQCHREAIGHRRLILIYLISSNICLGRFPGSKLLMRREAVDVAKRFLPLCRIIAKGDLGAFHRYLDLADGNERAHWLLQKRVLLQLRNRCEILVWRSLIRKTYIMAGFKGEERKVPFVRLEYVRAAARWALKRDKAKKEEVKPPQNSINFSFGPGFGSPASSTSPNTTSQSASDAESDYTDPDFQDLAAAISETGFDPETGIYNDEHIGQPYYTPFDAQAEAEEDQSPTLLEIESIVHSLIQQGLLKGFVTHANPRFAIPGAAKGGGALVVGFPDVWSVVKAKETSGVPGWVRDVGSTAGGLGGGGGGGGGGGMGGRVVRLSGARPAGAGPGEERGREGDNYHDWGKALYSFAYGASNLVAQMSDPSWKLTPVSEFRFITFTVLCVYLHEMPAFINRRMAPVPSGIDIIVIRHLTHEGFHSRAPRDAHAAVTAANAEVERCEGGAQLFPPLWL